MGSIGYGELLVLGLIAMLVFGPSKLPEMAKAMGKALRAFQQESQKAASMLREETDKFTRAGVLDAPDKPPAIAAAAVAPVAALPEPQVVALAAVVAEAPAVPEPHVVTAPADGIYGSVDRVMPAVAESASDESRPDSATLPAPVGSNAVLSATERAFEDT